MDKTQYMVLTNNIFKKTSMAPTLTVYLLINRYVFHFFIRSYFFIIKNSIS